MNIDNGDGVAAVEQGHEILDGVFLPRYDLRNQLITSTI